MADINREIVEIKTRLDRLESRLSFLYRNPGITTQEATGWNASPALILLLQRGDKISAIRAFREETGASLKDAKDFIESLDV